MIIANVQCQAQHSTMSHQKHSVVLPALYGTIPTSERNKNKRKLYVSLNVTYIMAHCCTKSIVQNWKRPNTGSSKAGNFLQELAGFQT